MMKIISLLWSVVSGQWLVFWRSLATKLLSLLLILFLTACGTGTPSKPPYKGIKVGKPYEVNGKIYVPEYKPAYDEIGIASWYGPGFHGGQTASGERYNQDDLTAAHKTLPLPALVRVTNLDNGISTILRVNDRGPFVAGRIIDLSKGSALKLGVYRSGTAKVRVQFLDKETRDYVSTLPNGAQSLAMLDRYKASNVIENVKHQEIVEIADAGDDNAPDSNAALPFSAPPVKGKAATQTDWSKQDQADFNSIIFQPPPLVKTPNTTEKTGALYVQIGTYGVRQNANIMFERIARLGRARVSETDVSGHKFYRVQSGPFNSEADAKNRLSKLQEMGISGARIVRN